MPAALFTGTACDPESLRQSIRRHVRYTLARPQAALTPTELLKPVSLALRECLIDRMLETEQRYQKQAAKRLHYLSMEFLMGRWLSDNLCNLRLYEECRAILKEDYGIGLDEVLEVEPVAGFGGQTVNHLRLFTARASQDFDIEIFNSGDYIRAVEQKIGSENISRVLYPSDSVMSGKELRLIQEYFLVACSLHDIFRKYLAANSSLDDFPAKVAVQMNDTHPSLCVAE